MKITLILDNLAGVPPETLAILNSANSFLTAYKPSSNYYNVNFLNLNTLNFLSILNIFSYNYNN